MTQHGAGVIVEYFSERPGLSAMVVGLLEGLGERFGTKVRAEQIRTREDHGSDAFHVQPDGDGS